MSIQKGPIQVMIGLIFKEKQQLALVIKNPSHQVRHIKEIKILINTGSVQTIKDSGKKKEKILHCHIAFSTNIFLSIVKSNLWAINNYFSCNIGWWNPLNPSAIRFDGYGGTWNSCGLLGRRFGSLPTEKWYVIFGLWKSFIMLQEYNILSSDLKGLVWRPLLLYCILSPLYYKYGTIRCSDFDFLDHTVRLIEISWKISNQVV